MNEEFPPKQKAFYREFDAWDFDKYGYVLQRMLAPIFPFQAQTIIDLFCGNGTMTAGALFLWPECIVHSVDLYHTVLSQTLSSDPRVVFHQGLVHELLIGDALPIADIVIIGNCGSKHGLTAENMNSLARHINTRGYLLTYGENAHLEAQQWFKQTFRLTHWLPDVEQPSIWKPK